MFLGLLVPCETLHSRSRVVHWAGLRESGGGWFTLCGVHLRGGGSARAAAVTCRRCVRLAPPSLRTLPESSG